ncbi:MAG: GntR family transcriptional regulator [Pseudomonadota bacterium]
MTDPHALPKYVQTAEMLIRDIGSGRLSDGERLPPEREMAADLGLSVGTLRKALSSLEEKGLLERIHGSGNYIRARADASAIYAFFRLELLDGGGLPTAEVLSVKAQEKPGDAPFFGAAAHGHRVRRLRSLSGQPVALEEVWIDGERAPSVHESDLSESLYLFYRKSLGFWISRAEDRVGIGPVPAWAPERFPPCPGDPAGYVERVAEDQNGAKVEYSRTWFDPDRARYVARLR